MSASEPAPMDTVTDAGSVAIALLVLLPSSGKNQTHYQHDAGLSETGECGALHCARARQKNPSNFYR